MWSTWSPLPVAPTSGSALRDRRIGASIIRGRTVDVQRVIAGGAGHRRQADVRMLSLAATEPEGQGAGQEQRNEAARER